MEEEGKRVNVEINRDERNRKEKITGKKRRGKVG